MTLTDCKQNLFCLLRLDFVALLLQAVLFLIGLSFIRVAGQDISHISNARMYMQFICICIGLPLYFGCAFTDYHVLGKYSWMLYLFSLALLSLVFVFGGKDESARSVLSLGGSRSIQVSELVKPATLLFISWLLTSPLLQYSLIPPIVIWGAAFILPFGMIVAQGDAGTALVFLPFSLAILFINGLKWRWVFLGLLTACLGVYFGAPIVFHSLKPYQKNRIAVFLNEPVDTAIELADTFLPHDSAQAFAQKCKAFQLANKEEYAAFLSRRSGKKVSPQLDDWNDRQAKISVSSGFLHGRGYGQGPQHRLAYLPRNVAPTDFIFAVYAEETGFAGSILLLLLFSALICRLFWTAWRATDDFGASLAAGVAILFTTHLFINIGMCIGMAPIIGIPLPFVSYGGSFLLATMILSGLAQSVHAHSQTHTRLR